MSWALDGFVVNPGAGSKTPMASIIKFFFFVNPNLKISWTVGPGKAFSA
jgi:hypothetical protein